MCRRNLLAQPAATLLLAWAVSCHSRTPDSPLKPPTAIPPFRQAIDLFGNDSLSSIEFIQDGRAIVASDRGGEVRRLDLDSGERTTVTHSETGTSISCLISIPHRAMFAQGKGFYVRVFSTASNEEMKRFDLPVLGGLRALTITPDEKYLVTSHGGVRLWDIETGVLHLNAGEIANVSSLDVSSDGVLLATGDQNGFSVLWNLTTRKQVSRWSSHEEMITATRFSPDGSILATSSTDRDINLWSTKPRALIASLKQNDRGVLCMVFSRDGRMLATGDMGGLIRLWEVWSGRLIMALEGHPGSVYGLSFSRRGSLASCGTEGKIFVWNPISAFIRNNGGEPSSVDELWLRLGGENAHEAYQAIGSFIQAKTKTADYFQAKHSTIDPGQEGIFSLISQLDDDDARKREEATEELSRLGLGAQSHIEDALRGTHNAEVRRRLEEALNNLLVPTRMRPSTLRQLRSIQILELLGTPEAKEVLIKIAESSPSKRLMTEARAAVGRIEGIDSR